MADVYKGRCLHAGCWCASCPLCKRRVTAHDFTAEDAQAGLDDHMAKAHPSGSDLSRQTRRSANAPVGPVPYAG